LTIFVTILLVGFFFNILLVGLKQLLRIEEELGAAAVYAGAKFRAPVEPY
jgi:hypothetical protein